MGLKKGGREGRGRRRTPGKGKSEEAIGSGKQ